MKKQFLTALLALSFSFFSTHGDAQAFHNGDNILAPGLGLGSSLGGFDNGSQTPAISLQYEHGNWDIGGPGVISLGGYLGYKGYSYSNVYYSEKLNYIVIGLRSAYHFNMLQAPKWDLYAGLMLSYNITSYSYNSRSAYYDNLGGNYGSGIGLSLYVGGRYFVSEKVALFAELGYGVSYFTIGAAFRL